MSPLRPDDLKPPFVEASALHIEDPGFATVISLDCPPQVTANQKRGVQLDLTSTVERSNQLQPYAQLISFQSVLKEGRAFLGMSTEQKASQNGDCNSPVTAPPGAWKDGRTLSEAQRERKRAVNRLNRRLQRQNKREDQIAALELQLERLKGQEDSPTRSIENGFNVWDPGSSESPSAAVYSGSHSDSPKCQFDPPYSPSLGYSKLFEEEEKNVPKLEQRLTAASPYLMRESSARDITQMLNIGIGMALTASIEDISTDAVFNESVLSHAIIYGWKSSIEKHQPTCPMLNALRYLDETLFHEAGPLERLAMMHCISRQLLTLRLGSTDERQAAWPWYKPRPSQLSARHDIAVDYIVWPGMRERLIFMGATALTNAFWANFFRNFRFYWPSDIKEAFQLTEDSQLLAFSGELQNRFRDLPHWRMDTEFLNKFPDFVCDVQAYESIPTTLELWKPVDPVRLRRLVLRNSDKRKAEKDDDRLQFSL